jgi:hypothetical protein
MRVLTILAEEHLFLKRLIGRIQTETEFEAEGPHQRVSGMLLTFWCAMKRHEELERLVFDGLIGLGPRAESLLREARDEELELEAIRADTLAALREPWTLAAPRFKPLVRQLAFHVRMHFSEEESLLWPRFCRIFDSRSLDHMLEPRARRQLKLLESEVLEHVPFLSENTGRYF